MLTEQQFTQYLDQIQEHFDSIVESGDDQALFISSYLNGHFSLVASQCINEQLLTLNHLDAKMQESLLVAFENGELEQEDQQQVYAFWQSSIDLLIKELLTKGHA